MSFMSLHTCRFHPTVVRSVLCTIALGIAACGATDGDAIDTFPELRRAMVDWQTHAREIQVPAKFVRIAQRNLERLEDLGYAGDDDEESGD